MTERVEYACLLCDEPGLHVHERPAREVWKPMTTTLYRLVDDRDGSLVVETSNRALFREALQGCVDPDADGFVLPPHYTITVIETASGEAAGALAWSIVR